MKKVWLILLIFATVEGIQSYSASEWDGLITYFDASGYYLYLPATFIYRDIEKLEFYEHVDSTNTLYYQPKTWKRLNKYPIGVAIGELPFFLVGHAYTIWFTELKQDGYTRYYQFWICFATMAWALIGLYFLGKFLLYLWGENVVAITVLIIAFGTNLYCYAVTNFGMPHSFAFMLFAMIL